MNSTAKRKSRSTAPKTHQSVILEAQEEEAFRIVVVADTHSRPHPNTAQVIQAQSPHAILHAGDVGRLSVLDELAQLAPLTTVRGNIDGQEASLPDSVDVDIVRGGRRALKLLLLHIAVYGPKLRAEVFRSAQSHGARMVVCGHSHVPFLGRDRGLILFNPGSIGPRRGHLPITLGLLEVGLSAIHLHHINCETGERWAP